MTPASLLALLLAAAAAPKAPARPPLAPPSPAPEAPIRVITLDPTKPEKAYRIRTAVSAPVTVDLPEPFAASPSCGDCGTDKGLFHMEVFSELRYLSIGPRLYPGPQANGVVITADEFFTNVIVRLTNNMTITLLVELASREEADTRVVFKMPHSSDEPAYIQQQLDKARKALEADFARKLDQEVSQTLLRALAEPHHCSPASDRVRHEDVVLELQELCLFGSTAYLRFTLENRGKEPLALTVLEIRPHGSKATQDSRQLLPQREVEFRHTATGVLSFAPPEGSRSFDLVVGQTTGRVRELVLPFSF